MDPFFKHWKKNYRDINQLPYYAYLYQKEEVQFEPEVSEPVVVWNSGYRRLGSYLKRDLRNEFSYSLEPCCYLIYSTCI